MHLFSLNLIFLGLFYCYLASAIYTEVYIANFARKWLCQYGNFTFSGPNKKPLENVNGSYYRYLVPIDDPVHYPTMFNVTVSRIGAIGYFIPDKFSLVQYVNIYASLSGCYQLPEEALIFRSFYEDLVSYNASLESPSTLIFDMKYMPYCEKPFTICMQKLDITFDSNDAKNITFTSFYARDATSREVPNKDFVIEEFKTGSCTSTFNASTPFTCTLPFSVTLVATGVDNFVRRMGFGLEEQNSSKPILLSATQVQYITTKFASYEIIAMCQDSATNQTSDLLIGQ